MNHAIQRCKDRYGVDITASDIERMNRDIALGRAILSAELPHGASVYIVRLPSGGTAKVAVRAGNIMTFLPPCHDTSRPPGKHLGRKNGPRAVRARPGKSTHQKYVRNRNKEIDE